MALPSSATFDYVVKVPEENGPNSFPWQLELGEEVEPTGDALRDDRLAGYSPLLSVTDGGFTADPFGLRDEVRLSRFTLKAESRTHASSRELSFEIEQQLTSLFRPGDELRLTHSCMWGTGLTLRREGKLVVAVGAICGKLDNWIGVAHPKDATERIARFTKAFCEYKQKKPLFLPIEVRVGERMICLYAGRAEIGGYEIWVQGGTNYAYPSGDSYAAIWAKGMCSEWCAINSAMSLKAPGMTVVNW